MKKHICIDFEGEGRRQDGSVPHPSLLGAWIPRTQGTGGDYNLWIFEPELAPITRGGSISGKPENRQVCSLQDCIAQLVKLAADLDCRLVAFSEHEQKIVKTHLPTNSPVLNPFLEAFFNIRPKARSLARRRRLQFDDNSLVSLLTALSPRHKWPPPPAGGAAEACRRLRRAGSRSRRWRQWNERSRKLAADLIAYNRGDCVAVMRLVNRVSTNYNLSDLR